MQKQTLELALKKPEHNCVNAIHLYKNNQSKASIAEI